MMAKKVKKARNLKAGKKLEQQRPLITKVVDMSSPKLSSTCATGKHL